MKKIIILLVNLFLILSLTSCGKTKFEDLPKEKQTEIQNKIKEDVLAPYIKDILALTFKNMNASKEETDKITTQKAEEFKQDLIKYLVKNYPDIEFDIDKISKIDNSKTEEKKIEKPKEYTKIPLGSFYEFKKAEDEKIKIKVNDIIWKGKEYKNNYNGIEKANNEFLFVNLESENIGKKPTFKSLYDVKLITKDGYEFTGNSEQFPGEGQGGYSSCIECEHNPLTKQKQTIIFDIQKIDLAGAKIRFEDDLIDFEL